MEQINQCYYSKGYINVSYSYYFSEGSNWFDVYAYNDFELNEIPSDYTLKLDPTDFGKSYSNSSFNKNGYSITYKQIINNANSIQFKKTSKMSFHLNPSSSLFTNKTISAEQTHFRQGLF